MRRPLAANTRHSLELIATHHHDDAEEDAYEELLGDALQREAFRLARQDYTLEACGIVDNVLNIDERPTEYEVGSWGPEEANSIVPGGWLEAHSERLL